MKKWVVIGCVLLVLAALATVNRVTSQPAKPTFAGVSRDELEENGIHLSFPDESNAASAISESQAREVAASQFGAGPSGGLRINESVLAILTDDQPSPGYNGPVWVFGVDPSSVPGGTGGDPLSPDFGKPRMADAMLLFVNATTGEFLFASEFGHIAVTGKD